MYAEAPLLAPTTLTPRHYGGSSPVYQVGDSIKASKFDKFRLKINKSKVVQRNTTEHTSHDDVHCTQAWWDEQAAQQDEQATDLQASNGVVVQRVIERAAHTATHVWDHAQAAAEAAQRLWHRTYRARLALRSIIMAVVVAVCVGYAIARWTSAFAFNCQLLVQRICFLSPKLGRRNSWIAFTDNVCSRSTFDRVYRFTTWGLGLAEA